MESDPKRIKKTKTNKIKYQENFAAGLCCLFPIALAFPFLYLFLWKYTKWTLPENLMEIPLAFLWGFLFPIFEKRSRANLKLKMGLWGAVLGVFISIFWDLIVGLPYRQSLTAFKPSHEIIIAPISGFFYFLTWGFISAPIYQLISSSKGEKYENKRRRKVSDGGSAQAVNNR